MMTHTTSFEDWQSYTSSLDLIHVTWLKQAKKSKTAFAVAEINKDELKIFLTKTKIKPLHHPAKVLIVEEIPKLGSGKTDFDVTKKIALVNDQQ